MKKVISLLLIVILALGLCSCNIGKDKRVLNAIDTLKEYWAEEYSKDLYKENNCDGYFEIINTRLIEIKENNTAMFKDVDYIVEFELFTDYFCNGLYYENVSMYDTVIVYKDGTTKVDSDYITRYRSTTFSNDFSAFIESVENYGDKYNCVEKLTKDKDK